LTIHPQHLEYIRRYIEARRETDRIMPVWLPLLPFILILILAYVSTIGIRILIHPRFRPGIIVFPIVWYMIASIILIAVHLFNVYIVYRWIDRRNKHFRRVLKLFESMRDYIVVVSTERGVHVKGKLQLLERDIRDAGYEWGERDALIWAILQLIPIIGLPILIYVYHFLNKDFYTHSKMERYVLSSFSSVALEVDPSFKPVSFHPDYEFPDRSTAIYIVATIATLGFFILYWVYTLTKDPNEHFKEHRIMEDKLLEELSKIG